MELLVRRSLPQASPLARWLSGTDYSGNLKIRVAGLPASQSQEVSFRCITRACINAMSNRLQLVVSRRCDNSAVSRDSLLVLVFIWKRRKDASVERLMRQADRKHRR